MNWINTGIFKGTSEPAFLINLDQVTMVRQRGTLQPHIEFYFHDESTSVYFGALEDCLTAWNRIVFCISGGVEYDARVEKDKSAP